MPRNTITSIAAFLETLQKLADIAHCGHSGLKELGISMTRLCLRERGFETRLRAFNSHLSDGLAVPLADRVIEWKRSTSQLDREFTKERRRAV
ncbi:unnamed protein product, partial [Protopolystoma xenopodis]